MSCTKSDDRGVLEMVLYGCPNSPVVSQYYRTITHHVGDNAYPYFGSNWPSRGTDTVVDIGDDTNDGAACFYGLIQKERQILASLAFVGCVCGIFFRDQYTQLASSTLNL